MQSAPGPGRPDPCHFAPRGLGVLPVRAPSVCMLRAGLAASGMQGLVQDLQEPLASPCMQPHASPTNGLLAVVIDLAEAAADDDEDARLCQVGGQPVAAAVCNPAGVLAKLGPLVSATSIVDGAMVSK